MLKEKLLKNKKRLAIVSVMALCLCVGTLIGGKMIVDNVKADENLAKTPTETVTIIDKETGDKEVVKADSKEAKEAKSDPNVKVTENKSSKDTSNKSSNKNSNTSSSNKTNKTDNKDKGNSRNKDNGSTNSKPSTPSKPSEPSKPAHTHSWVADYTTKDVYEDQPIYGQRCNTCGYTCQGGIGAHMDANWDTCESYATGVVIGYSKVKVGTEKVPTGTYHCSCGATK